MTNIQNPASEPPNPQSQIPPTAYCLLPTAYLPLFKLWDQSVRGILISKYGEPDSIITVNGKDTGRLWQKWRDKEITLFEEQNTLSDSIDVFLFYQMPEKMLKEALSDL